MSKLPFMPFFPDAWLRDTRRLTRDCRAIWIDIIAYAWNEPSRGVYHRSLEAFCREHHTDLEAGKKIILELAQVADVTVDNGEVTVVCRRMVRIESARISNGERQARHREKKVEKNSNAKVTPLKRKSNKDMLDVRRYTLDVINDKNISLPQEKKYAVPLPEEKPLDSLVMLYKVLQGVPHDFRPWDKAWGRWKQKAQELVEIFGGDYAKAYACLKQQGEGMNTKGYTWKFQTILDGAHLWRQKHEGEEYAHVNRDRFLRDLIDQRKQKRVDGLRRVAEDVDDRRGDPRDNGLLDAGADPKPFPSPVTRSENGRGDHRNGRVVSGFSPESLEGEADRDRQPVPDDLGEVWSDNGRGDDG